MTDGQLLEFSRVTKRFGALTAVDDLSAQIAPGTVTGFLGPNGAGKTTSLRILLGQVRATSGTATIGGKAYSELRHPLRTVGAVMEDTAYRPRRTATRQLTIAAKANGIPLSRVAEVLALVGLQNETETRIGAYSLGMRQRLSVAHALLGDPGALVLDEPANGLDPEGIRWMRLLIRRLADEGRTVLVSSHVLSEIEQIADDVLVLSKGRLVYADSMSKLSDPTTGSVVVDAEDRDALAAALSASGLSHDVLRSGLTVHDTDAATVGALAASAGLALTTLQQRGPTLEEVFLDLVHGRRDPVAGGTRASAAAAAAGTSATGAPDDAPEAALTGAADATTALPVVGDAESPVSAGAAIGAGAAAAGAAVAGGLLGTEGGSEPSTRRAARTQAEDADAGDEPADADAAASAAEDETPDETFATPLAEGEAPASDDETTGDSASDESTDAADDEPGDVVADESKADSTSDESTDDETPASPEDAEPTASEDTENDAAEETAADAATAEDEAPDDASASDTAEDSAVAAGVALTAPIDTDTDFGVSAASAGDGADITTPSEQDDDRADGPLPFATAAISVPDAAPEPTFDELISGVPASAQADAASGDEAPTTALPVPAESSETDAPEAEDAPETEVDAPADAEADAPDDAEERGTEEGGADGRAAAEADTADVPSEDAPEAPSEVEVSRNDEASAEDATSAEEPPTETSGITGIEIFSSLTEGQTQAIPVVLDASHGSEPEDADDVTKDEDPRAAAVSASLAAAARAYYSEDAPSYTPGDAEPDEERRTWRIASTGVIDTVPTAEEGERPADAADAPAAADADDAETSEEQHSDATPDDASEGTVDQNAADAADAHDRGEGEEGHDGSEDGERPRD